MCGIAAMVGREPSDLRQALERALHSMQHRGPDGDGIWTSPDARIGLAHTRLAIMDPAGAGQPIANETGRIRAVVNGEFYDFERHRRELESRGHRFATRGDSELLVHLYEDHRETLWRHLRGEFAFVIHDLDRSLVIAGRDRFG